MMVSSSRNDEAILAERQKMEEVYEQNGSRIAQSSRLNCVDQALKKSSNVQTVKALGSNVEVKPSSGDVIATSKRQKTEEGHEKNGCSTRQAPRSFAGVFAGGDEDDDEGPIVFKRSPLPSKSKAVIDTTATKKDVLLISVVNEVLKSDKPESQPRVAVKKVASTTSTSAPNSISNPSCFTTRDSHFKQPKSTSTLPPNPLSGKKISISSTVSANSSVCQNVNVSVSPDFSGRKTHQTPCDYKASVSASRFAPDKLLHTSSNQQKDVVHRKASGASLGTSISQSSNCSTMEQEMHSSHSSKISNLAATKDSEIVTSVAFIKKSSSKFEKDNSDSIENKPLVTKLASSTEQMVAVRQSATRPESSFKTTSQSEEDSGSEDDKPLCERLVSRNVVLKNVSDKSGKPSKLGSSKEVSDGSDDDKPLAQRLKPNASKKALGIGTAQTGKHLGDKKPLGQERLTHFSMKSEDKDKLTELSSKKRSLDQNTSSICSSAAKKLKVFEERAMLQVKHKPEAFSDDEDEVPLAKRSMSSNSTSKPVTTKKVSSGMAMATKKVLEARKAKMGNKKKASSTKSSISMPKGAPVSGGAQKWTTLEHNGVIFPPPYRPHGIKILYDGKPVNLTPAQEEVATMFAVMKDTDYATKQKFISNFWSDWKQILGSNNVVKKLELCDFTPIYEWHIAEKEKKKSMSAEEKKRIKAEKLKLEETYMWALVDGVKEKVGNFRVEPPGLFRGRGEHPKMGKLKKRIFPENIVINVGEDAPIPECPMPGHRWKEIRHDNTVTWLAYWNDPINSKEFKYVFLAPSSSLKGQSDKEKYEKSRKLKDYIEDIRKTYTKGFSSSDSTRKQIAVATYLIDRLALRAGNEKDDDEADTVGCCSLKVEHVSLIPPRSLEFDFLGKDSIRYFNTVEVDDRVYKAIGDFKISKAEGDDLFDTLDTSKLNAHLKEIMPGLTAKVFRTYNASITLDTQLQDTNGNTLIEKIAAYQGANKEVAILCNHQRSVSKSHSAQMERLELKMVELQALRMELKRDLDRAKKGKSPLKDADGKIKRNQIPDALQKKLDQTNQKIKKMELDMRVKDDLKTVALGTSKINYMDPRITVAWCKLHEVPIEKIFNKSLLAKFSWAMDVEPDFRF